MGRPTIEAVTELARAAELDLGDETAAVAERLLQLHDFVRELDDLAPADSEIGATYDPAWGES